MIDSPSKPIDKPRGSGLGLIPRSVRLLHDAWRG
jgi:hypothetical protein